MNAGSHHLSGEQRKNAIQRLTALWAFTESGPGGIMHALHIPLTGLVVGGMAVIMISLIAFLSGRQYNQVLKSAIIVLIVKATVSPHTPIPAYIAVSFQALFGFALFYLLSVNFISILVLSCIAMAESAMQKILILTLFFGKSLWTALDNMIAWLTGQFGAGISNGSYWLVLAYLLIYLVAGFFIARIAYQSVQYFGSNTLFLSFNTEINSAGMAWQKSKIKKRRYKKVWGFVLLMLALSLVLFLFAKDTKHGWLAIVKTISRTLSAIVIWFMLVGPLLTKLIKKLLQKKESRYSAEVLQTVSFLPVIHTLTTIAWQQSKSRAGLKRWGFFVLLLIHASITYSDPALSEIPVNQPA